MNDMKQRLGFYSLSRRAYSGTRTARSARSQLRFYSLSRRAYSGTGEYESRKYAYERFLFACLLYTSRCV